MTTISFRSFIRLLLISILAALPPSFQAAAFQSPKTRATRLRISPLSSSELSTVSSSEIKTLFNILSDSSVLYDPSRGTCCRNKCSGCTYLDTDGNFLYDEFSTKESDEIGGWIAPYIKVDFGEKMAVSSWSKLLFSDNNEIEKDQLKSILSLKSEISQEAINALWVTISPSVGYPRLKSSEVIRAIKGIEGAISEMGGAVDYNSFHRAMTLATAMSGDVEVVDYDALSKEELLELCVERGMKTNFPKMKRIIIEELRFFDANGRQGKRHPTKNTLS